MLSKVTILLLLVLWSASSSLAKPQPLKIGIHAARQNIEFATSDGSPSGLLPDIWRHWGAQNGRTLEFVIVDDQESDALLQEGRIDILANALPGQQLSYSAPYAQHPYFLITTKDHHLESPANLPLKVGLLKEDSTCLNDTLHNQFQPLLFSSYPEMITALLNGRIDYIAANDIALNIAVNSSELIRLHYPDKPFHNHPVRAAVQPGKEPLLHAFEAGIAGLSTAQRVKLHDKWQPSTVGYRLPWSLIGYAALALVAALLLILAWLMNLKLEHKVAAQTLELEEQKQALESDIERRKLLETKLKSAEAKAFAATEEKARFLATMTHELRTPLIGVLGMSELMQKTPLTSHQQTLLATMHGSGDTLLALVNDLLDFSKLEASKLTLRIEKLNLPELLKESVQLLSEQADGKNLRLECKIANSACWEVYGDPLRLRQIVLNLLSNAIKFTSQGEVQVSLELSERLDQDGIFVLKVEDSGIGMNAGECESIFAPFKQVECRNSVAAGGTGLGLAIVKQLIDLMQGTIEVTSRPGEGSLFQITLPLPLHKEVPSPPIVASRTNNLSRQENLPCTSEPESESQQMSPQPPPTATQVQRILVVDDYPVTRQLIQHSLAGHELQIDEAENGKDALALTENVSYDLILMDRSMPGIDGLETTRRLRARGYRAPIVALTAHADSTIIQACHEAGMDDCLTKPFRQKELFELLDKWLVSGD